MSRWLRRFAAATLCLAVGWVLWFSVVRGRAEQRAHSGLFLGAAPLVGRDSSDGWIWRFGWGLVGAIVLAGLVVASCWGGWWWRLRQRWVIGLAAAGAASFAVLLALTDGLDGLRYGAQHKSEYLANLRNAPPAAEFLRTFVTRIERYSVHVRGHPPGYVLFLKAADAVGLGGVWPVVAFSIAGTATVAGAVLLTVRSVAGEEWMRRSAPFLIVAPYSIWMMTSADAVFASVGALGVAAVAAGIGRSRRQAWWCGVAAGLLLGGLLFLTYLGAVLLVLPGLLLLVGVWQRRGGTWLVVAGGAAAALFVVGSFWWAGFWWFDGVAATDREYRLGTAQFRSWSYFKFGNLGAALFALGPSTVVGLAALRHRRMWLLVGATLSALAISHLSQYTKGEVERIWLLFFPWIAIAGGALAIRSRRGLTAIAVGVQAACAVVLQAALVTKW